MKIGIGLGSQNHLPTEDLVGLMRQVTELNFDTVWTTHQAKPSPFDLCDRWATESADLDSNANIGIAIIPAPQWRPEVVATRSAKVSEVSRGHFVLGIGTGGYGDGFWQKLGMPNRPIAIMREQVEMLRSALSGELTNYEGEIVKLRNFKLASQPPAVPIYLAALGPQMMRLVGKCADGALTNWASPDAIAESSKMITEGATSVGRLRSDVSLTANIRCCIDDDVDAARRVVAKRILEKVIPTSDRREPEGNLGYRGQFVRLGFEEELIDLEQRHAAGQSREELLDVVSEAFCSAAGYFGTAKDAPRRLAQLANGLDEMILRIETITPGVEAVSETMEALTPAKIRSAIGPQ